MSKFDLKSFLNAHGKPTARIDADDGCLQNEHDLLRSAQRQYGIPNNSTEAALDLQCMSFDHLEERLSSMKPTMGLSANLNTLNLDHPVSQVSSMPKTCQNRTQPSGAPSTADNDGDDLDTRLLEGALKNLDYFPQLLKEVQHIKKAKDDQKRKAEQLRKSQDKIERRQRRLREKEYKRSAEKQKVHAFNEAQNLIKEAEREKLKTRLAAVRADTEAFRCLTDSLESKIHTAEHQLETQDKVVSVLQTSIREAGQRVSSNDVIDTSGEEIYTSKGQADALVGGYISTGPASGRHPSSPALFVKLIKVKSDQTRQIESLRQEVNQLQTEKTTLLNSQVSGSCTDKTEPKRQQVLIALSKLKETRDRLQQSLKRYR